MTIHPIRRHALILLAMLLPLHAEEPALRDMLRDALYTEEVSADAEKAAKQYEALIARHDEQRSIAANALYRLAEIHRQQDRKDEAAALYRRLLTAFSDVEPQAKLSRERLAGLGETPAEGDTAAPALDDEAKELMRLQQLALASPDLLRKPAIIIDAVQKGWARPIAFVLGQVDSPISDALALDRASSAGHLAIVKMVLARGLDPKSTSAGNAVLSATMAGNLEVVKALLAAGVSPDFKPDDNRPTPLAFAARKGDLEIARLLIDKGADVNLTPSSCFPQLTNITSNPYYIGGPLHEAINASKPEIIDLLLAHKADVNLTEPRGKITPLWLAAFKGMPDLVKRLLDLGADPDTESATQPESAQQINQNFGWVGYPGKSTALQRAVIAGSLENVKLILEAKKARKTPLQASILYDAILMSQVSERTLEITQLLLDAGADPNPKLPNFKSVIEEISKKRQPNESDKMWPIVELLLARGSRIDLEWEEAGFPDSDPGIWKLLMRRISYPKWAAEKAIRIVDFTTNSQSWPTTKPESPDSTPPVLEKWLLEEEIRDLGNLRKNLSGFALYRKTEKGIVEVSVIDLEGDEAFPKLHWGDILEKRGETISSASNWSDKAKEAMGKRVNATAKPPEPGRPSPLSFPRPPRARVVPVPPSGR